MSLKHVPSDYIAIDDEALEDLLEKLYNKPENSTSMEDTDADLVFLEEFFNTPEIQIERKIIIYTSPFVLFFSTVGNIFTFLIMCKMFRLVWSTCIYLAILSILDLFIVYTWCGNDWVMHLTNTDISYLITSTSNSRCKVYTFMVNSVLHMSKWLMVCLSIECFMSAKYPQRMHELCNLKRSKAIILLLTVLICCINIHHFWTYKSINFTAESHQTEPAPDERDYYLCSSVQHGMLFSKTFETIVWPVIDILVAQVLPFLLVTFFSSLSVYYIRKGPGLCEMMTENWRKKFLLYPNGVKEMKIAFVVIGYSFFLTLPQLLFILYAKLLDVYDNAMPAGKSELATTCNKTIIYIFLSLKFYILFATSKHFREEFYKICRFVCRCQRKVKDSEEQCKGTMMASNQTSLEFYSEGNDSTFRVASRSLNNTYDSSLHQHLVGARYSNNEIEHTVV